jgi:hypothetical protein
VTYDFIAAGFIAAWGASIVTNPVTKNLAALVLLATLGPSVAFAAPKSVTGSAALALAAVLAPHSPLLSAKEKRVVASLFDGNTRIGFAPKKKLSVIADSVMCRVSDVDITARSCNMTFNTGKKTSKRSLSGRAANEVYATMAMAGVVSEGAAGSLIQTITRLNCALDPGVIKQKGGGGAKCSFRTDA